MKYKILISNGLSASGIMSYSFYQTADANDVDVKSDWESDSAETTANKFKELLSTYSLSRLKVVVDIPVTIDVEIPEVSVI